MATICPIRRQALSAKRRSLNETKAADVLKLNHKKDHQIDHNIVYKSVALIYLASMKNMEHPGSFAEELNELYRKNNLPILNLDGFVPPTLRSFSDIVQYSDGEPGSVHRLDKVSTPKSEPSEVTHVDIPPLVSGELPASADGLVSDGGEDSSRLCVPPSHSGEPSSRLSEDQLCKRPTQENPRTLQPPVWHGFRVYKTWKTKVSSTDELLRAWERGDALIAREDGSIPDYNTVTSVLSKNILPKMLSLRKEEFNDMASSPKRIIGKRSLKR